ncbi:MAG TPA: tetratricopeptide repeat protein [Candidatus Eisenbacteria bacterium]
MKRPAATTSGAALPMAAALAAFLIYLPTLSYPFLNWDDTTYVVNNPWIRGWSIGNLAHVFTTPYFSNFLPLHLVSYMVDYSLWGLDPFGYHLQSVLLHALNAALAFLVVKRLIGRHTVAFLAALFFAVHPSHVEAVAWISIRKDLLSTTFALSAMAFYVRATDARGVRPVAYVASVACFTLGMLSKVTIVTLPAFLLVLDRFPSEGRPRNRWTVDLATKIPFAAIGLWLVHLNSTAQTTATASYARDAWSYLAVKGRAAWNYLALLAGAARGSPDYDLPSPGPGVLARLGAVAGLVALPALALVALRLGSRAAFLGLAWVFVFLLPALAFPLVTYMADRYLYLPSLGFCWATAAGISWLARRLPTPRARAATVAALGLATLVGLGARTVQALPVWRDSESLWSYALTRCGDFRAYTNLAAIRLEQGRWDEAERLLRVSARVEDVTTYQNLAVLYFRTGRYQEALGAIDHALAILRRRGRDPALASVLYYSRGAITWQLGDAAETEKALEAAVREDPSNAAARTRLDSVRRRPFNP